MAAVSVLDRAVTLMQPRLRDAHGPARIGVRVAHLHRNLESPAWILWLNAIGCSGALRGGVSCALRRAMAAN